MLDYTKLNHFICRISVMCVYYTKLKANLDVIYRIMLYV